jgi:hypothetical protein
MSELKNTETAVSKFDDKLHKLIKRAKKQRGMLWPSVVSKLELARRSQADALKKNKKLKKSKKISGKKAQLKAKK